MDQLDIGIDGFNLAMPNGTGVATYGYTLAATLYAGGHRTTGLFGIDAGRDPALAETLFFDALGNPPARTRPQRLRLARRLRLKALNPFVAAHATAVPRTGEVETRPLAERLPPFDRIATYPHLFELAHRLFRTRRRFLTVHMADPPPIMHWTYPLPLRLAGARNVYTLHDLVPLGLPYTTLDGKADYHALIRGCIAQAAHLCTVSETSRADIIARFGIAPAAITNTGQASPMPAEADDGADAGIVARTFGLGEKGYFLYFGAIEPKKNIGRLIEAYLAAGVKQPLVLVGGRGWRSEEELRLLPAEGEPPSTHDGVLADRIRRLDHLPRALLRRLIRNARAVVFPSIYEGFGLPVLEAMQLGVPVLTAATGALAELAGEAAVLADPYDVAAIAAGLRALATDDALVARLAAAGPARAAIHAPARYLARLEAMYRLLAAA